ncbi:MAG: hypothetical protein ACI4SH_02960 [Candidatus Scatosoma sp.]
MKLNLTAADQNEEIILHYLENNASETLADKINNGTPFENPDKDFSIIMDSYGLFEKKWQFSADLIKRGFKIIEVSDDKLRLS